MLWPGRLAWLRRGPAGRTADIRSRRRSAGRVPRFAGLMQRDGAEPVRPSPRQDCRLLSLVLFWCLTLGPHESPFSVAHAIRPVLAPVALTGYCGDLSRSFGAAR